MAITLTDTTYAGEAAEAFIVKALTGNETVDGGHVYLQSGIKKKFTIPRLTLDANIQDYAAEPSASGNITITGKVLEPRRFMIYKEFNPKDMHDHWYANQINGNLLDESLPQTMESAIIQEQLKAFDNYMNKALWQNKLTNTNEFKYWDGFIYNALNDSSVIDIATPTTLSAANIEAEFQTIEDGIRDSIPDLLYDMDCKWFVSYKTAKLWEAAQFAGTYKGSVNTERGKNQFHGFPIIPIKGMADDTVLVAKANATPSSNLWMGINDTADMTVQIGRKNAYGDLWFVKMLFEADVQIGFGAEVALYTSLTY